jgi:pentatricopeptide repeat protein
MPLMFTWLTSLLLISGCRQMIKWVQISNIRRHREHFGLRTKETRYVWQQRWLQWQQTVQLNILAWNQKLTKYLKDGQPKKAMRLFQKMQLEGMSPDAFTFVQVI